MRERLFETRSPWPKRLAIALVSLFAADQLLLYTVLSDGVFLGNTVAPFPEPLFSNQQRRIFAELKSSLANDRARFERTSQFDPDLGWCPPRESQRGEAQIDWAGSRLGPEPLPRERVAGERLLGLVGCSFTLGSEVLGEETWAYQLDERWPGTRVGNFGVGGYGVDQALLRYRRDVAPLAPDEVWLGFFPGSAIRATSQYPPLYNRWRARTIHFKPRFALDEADELRLHPSPARNPEDIVRLIEDQDAFLEAIGDNDPWIGRARPAYLPLGAHWFHRSAFARIFLTLHERRGRNVQGMLASDASAAFRLNRALVLTLAHEVATAGSRFRVLILPSGKDLEELATEGEGHWQALVEDLRVAGIEVLDLTPKLIEAGVVQGGSYWMPEGHHSPITHRIIADVIAAAWGEP